MGELDKGHSNTMFGEDLGGGIVLGKRRINTVGASTTGCDYFGTGSLEKLALVGERKEIVDGLVNM